MLLVLLPVKIIKKTLTVSDQEPTRDSKTKGLNQVLQNYHVIFPTLNGISFHKLATIFKHTFTYVIVWPLLNLKYTCAEDILSTWNLCSRTIPFESQSNEQTISKIDIGLEIDFVCTEDEIQNEKKKECKYMH